MVEPYFPIDEYQARWERVHQRMAEQGFETAVVWGRSAGGHERSGDVLYLANYYSTHSGQGLDTPLTNARGFSAVILRAGETPELQADEPWPRTDLISTDRVDWSRDSIKAVADSLKARGATGRVALVGSDFLPLKYWRQLEAATPGIEWLPADDLVRDARLIKSPRELDCYREAGRVATRALDALIEGLLSGKSESEAAGDAAREVVRGGGHVHMIPVSHGELIEYFTSDPLAGHNHETAVDGDLVRGWVYGPMFQGYWLDPGRTVVVGDRPSNAQKEMVETTAGIVEAVIAAIRPGVNVVETARLGERMTKDAGGEKDQAAEKWPLFGHGVGLFFEKPYISVPMGDPDAVYEAGMVLGVEAFFARKGVGSAGFEQNVIVTESGTELLTTAPMLRW